MAQENAVEADGAEEEREDFAWLNQGPGTKLTGTFEGIIYAGRLDPSEAQNKSSFGVVMSDLQFDEGDLFVNDAKADDGFTVVDEDTGKRATDYRLLDLDDEGTTTLGDTGMVSDRSGATYSPGEVSEERVIVWYNGLSGQRVGRTLDFHGIPFAEYKQDGYLNKGLMQVCEGWRDANSQKRRELVQNGLGPRIARVPLPREDLLDERVSIEIERSGRAYYAHVFHDGEEVDMKYTENADERLDAEGVEMRLHHGEGWQDRPANARGPRPSFNIQVGGGEENEFGLSPVADAFATDVASALEGTGHTPETAFPNGLEGLMKEHGVDADVEDVRAAIHDRTSHLDPIEE